MLSAELVLEKSAIVTTLALAYIAVRARIRDAGIPSWRDLMPRINRIGAKAELSLADQLPVERFPNIEAHKEYLRSRIMDVERRSWVPHWTAKIQE
jgi:hypothetical protein